MDNRLIIPAFYLPPVAYFRAIHHSSLPLALEAHEHYQKQTYRTRASIYSANGRLDLIIPVQHQRSGHLGMKDIRISYEADWQRLHWMSLQTAYRSSAYFEYYEDDFAPFYNRRYEWLFDFHIQQLRLLLRLLKMESSLEETNTYREDYDATLDFRNTIHPKLTESASDYRPYYQVFGDKHGFIPNLSIVDLLFNHGPQSKTYL